MKLRSHECERGTHGCVRHIVWLVICFSAFGQNVDVGVFTLFKPVELRVAPANGPILVSAGDTRLILEGNQSYLIRGPVRVTGRDGTPADFKASVPGKIERRFHGTLTVRAGDHKLIAVVSMDREIAVASVVGAEMPVDTPIEALKAQAVIARSYYAATRHRHDAFDFCDTTHCQFLREPPEPASAAFEAARATHDLLLEYSGAPVAALYSAACGGRTRSLDDGEGYAYRSVDCDYCRRHSPGVVEGHQIGLCQAGAAGMAAAGADFRAILDHYYPGTALVTAPSRSRLSSARGLKSIFLLPGSLTLSHSKDE